MLYNISAITQPKLQFNGWIFECFNCYMKTGNYIICDMKYEIYICKHCIKKDINNRLSLSATKFCRKISATKINI